MPKDNAILSHSCEATLKQDRRPRPNEQLAVIKILRRGRSRCGQKPLSLVGDTGCAFRFDPPRHQLQRNSVGIGCNYCRDCLAHCTALSRCCKSREISYLILASLFFCFFGCLAMSHDPLVRREPFMCNVH